MDEGPFYHWLVGTQLAPVFLGHAFVQRACVLLIPQPWMLPASLRKPTPLLILYTARELIDLEAAVDALVHEAQDPNLPAGVSSYDLHLAIAWPSSDARRPPPPFALFPRASFVGMTRDPQQGHYQGMEAFLYYGSFARDGAGALVCRKFDARLSGLIDMAM
ncbi:MAG TPA: hypothetical protein VFZ61_28370 [Polyangiales bacterium]